MQNHYTGYEAAKIFGVAYRTILRWIYKGTLHAVKIGRSWYIPKEAVNELLEHGDRNNKR